MSRTEPPRFQRQNKDRKVSKEERNNPNRIYDKLQGKKFVVQCYRILQNNADVQELIIKNDYSIDKLGLEEVEKYIEKDLDNFILGNTVIIKALQQVFSKQGINIPEQKIIDKNECMMAKHELIHDLLIKREK